MSSNSATFELEFQTRGDEEIKQKLLDIGSAGKDAALDLQDLQGAGDELSSGFSGVGSALDSAVTPLEGLGSAASDAVPALEDMGAAGDELSGIFTGAGTEVETFGGALASMGDSSEAAVGGLTDASMLVDDFGTAATGAGSSATSAMGGIGQMSGSVVALGGTIGTVIGTVFRMQDAQLRLDKANLKSAKSTETARKAEVAFDTLLKGAKTNTDGIAQARSNLSDAQDKLNAMQEAGITSGTEYEAAQKGVADATAALKSQFIAGGGSATKFDAALNKVGLTAESARLAQEGADKAGREYTQTMIETGIGAAGMAGTIVAAVSSLGNFKTGAMAAGVGIKAFGGIIKTNLVAAISSAAAAFPAIISKMGALSPALVKIGGALGTFKLALAGSMGATVAFAAALGPAALAVGAFLLAIKGIEAIKTQVFDFFNGMGKMLGDLIPQLKGFLTDLGNASTATVDFLIRNTNRLLGQEQMVAENIFQLVDLRIKKSNELSMEEMKTADSIIESARKQGESFEQAGARILPILWKEKEGLISTKEASILMAGGTLEASVANETLADTSKIASVDVVGVRDSIAALPGAITPATKDIFTMSNSLVDLGTAEEEMSRAMEDGVVTAMEKQRITAALNKQLKEGQVAGGLFTDALAKEADIVNALNPVIATNIDYTKGLNSILQTSNSTVETSNQVVIKSGGAFVQLGGAIKDLGNGFSNINGTIVKNTNILNQEGLSVEKVDKAILPLTGHIRANAEAHVGLSANATTSATALNSLTQALDDETKKLNDNASNILRVVSSNENLKNAVAQVHVEYATSIDKLTDVINVENSAIASKERLQTALNNELIALKEESMALDDASVSADSLTLRQQRLVNAYKSGVVSIKEWANGLAEAKKEQAGQIQALGDMGAKWSDIPPFIERNVETLKLFGVAAKQGGEAAKEAASMASEAWRNATSEIGGELDSLAEIFKKGGEEMGESTAEWMTGIEQNIGRALTNAERAALEGIGNMIASTEQAIGDWQLGQIMGESIASSGTELAQAFDSLGAAAGDGMKAVFHRAAEIVRSDSSLAAAVNEVMANVGKTSPEALLRELNAILPPGLKDSATKAGEGIKGTLDPAAAAAGQSAALTLSQEFAAAGTHIAAVISGIVANINGIKQTTIPEITVNTDAVATNLNSVTLAINALKQTKIPIVTINTKAGHGLVIRLTAAINAIKQGRIPSVTVNIGPGTANLRRLQSQINGVRQSRVPSINVNISSGMSNINRIKNGINGIRGKTVYINVVQRRVGPRLVMADTVPMAGDSTAVHPMNTGVSTASVGGYSGGGRGGNDNMNFSGDVYLDTYKVGRVMGRAIAENNV